MLLRAFGLTFFNRNDLFAEPRAQCRPAMQGMTLVHAFDGSMQTIDLRRPPVLVQPLQLPKQLVMGPVESVAGGR